MIFSTVFILILFSSISITAAINYFNEEHKALGWGCFIMGCIFIYGLINILCNHFMTYVGGF